jgi:hypothetical protein
VFSELRSPLCEFSVPSRSGLQTAELSRQSEYLQQNERRAHDPFLLAPLIGKIVETGCGGQERDAVDVRGETKSSDACG